jgi:hypothetical protein
MTDLFYYKDPEEYDKKYAAIYNYDSYYCNKEKSIIIKNVDIL